MTASPLARKVMALPYRERERLLVELLDSLHVGDAGEVEAGNVATVPADQVRAEMRAGVLPGTSNVG